MLVIGKNEKIPKNNNYKETGNNRRNTNQREQCKNTTNTQQYKTTCYREQCKNKTYGEQCKKY